MPDGEKNVHTSKMSITESIRKIAEEVEAWPQWKQDLSGFRSDYPSELQPCRGDLIDKEKASTIKKQK